ncbi:MAG: hypothetical protein ACFE8A_08785 [Candidatus Hodarchaeota archaeon]
MKKKSIENKGKLFIIIIFIIFSLNIFLQCRIQNQPIAHFSDDFIENGEQKKPNTSASQSYTNEEWFKNTNFSSGINHWFNTTEIDSTDVKASNSSGQADFLVTGKELNFTYIANFSKPEEWQAKHNPYFNAFPEWPDTRGAGGSDRYGITPNGFWAQHNWSEGPRQEPSIQWVHDVELPVNISDYEIISASVLATVNATVDRNIDVSHPSDSPEGAILFPIQGDIYDYAHFYVRIAEPNYDPILDPPREIAWNKTKNLGLANDTESLYYLEMENTNMNTLSQQDLIDDLSSILSKDDQNFTIIVGIDIHSEDNCNSDMDFWNSTLINYFSLNFTYRKKINQFASVSWSQKGNMINFTHIPYYSYVRIDNALLNFKYKIDQTWPSESFNSEIKFLINNISQAEYPYTKLRSYNHSKLNGNFTEVKSGGYDVTDYIPIEKNITLTIQVLMLDEFNLDRIINISIDDVYFVISYTVFYNPPPPAADDDDDKTKTTLIEEPWFNVLIAIAAISGAICLGGYLLAYQLYLKYPKPVRKVRKYRRTLKRKKMPSVDITSREKAFNSIYREFSAISLLKGKLIEEKPSAKKINKSP